MYPPVLKSIGISDDDVSDGRTEDSLIHSRTSNESFNSEKKKSLCYQRKNSGRIGHYFFLFLGIILSFWGTTTTVYPPYDFLMNLRIRMIPGLPPFEWWYKPPDEVIFKLYIFNVTNSEKFMNGSDEKIKVEEIGPITYREKLIHSFPRFNDNGTFTYTANRTPIYLAEMNPIDLRNKTIVTPNLGVLFIPSYFYDATFVVKFGINVMMRSLKSSPFQKTTIQNFLWNASDPILDLAQSLAPQLVPTKNVGILSRMYADYVDNVTVFIGPKFDERKFFSIDNYDGSEYLPFRTGKCSDKVRGSSEGLSYPQSLTKNDTLKYFRKALCKVAELNFATELNEFGMKAYKYVMNPSSYNRTSPKNMDCYKGSPSLPNGLTDVSQCYYDTALAASFPHFLHGDDRIRDYVEGLKPQEEKHESYVVVEPRTGIPLHGAARSQINLVVKDMRGFNEKIQKFSNLTIPLVWIEYIQVGLPWYIRWLLYFQVVLLPVLQVLLSVFLLMIGVLFLYLFIRRRRQYMNNLMANKKLKFETAKFLSEETNKNLS